MKKTSLIRKSPKLTASEVMKNWLFIYQLLYPYEFLYKFLISKNSNKTNVYTKTGVNSDYGNSWFVVPLGTISVFRSDKSYLAVNPWPVYCISNLNTYIDSDYIMQSVTIVIEFYQYRKFVCFNLYVIHFFILWINVLQRFMSACLRDVYSKTFSFYLPLTKKINTESCKYMFKRQKYLFFTKLRKL